MTETALAETSLTTLILAVLVGGSIAAWVFTVAAVVYVCWKYVYQPWQVMRADVKALAEQLGQVKEEIGLRRAMSLSDEEQAMIERRVRARQLWTSPNAPTAPAVQKPRAAL